jgi:hypothetical protein
MKKIVFICLLVLFLPALAACGSTDTPTETATPTQPPVSEETEPPNRCAYFEGLDFSIVVYSIYPGDSTVTLYTKFPGQVIGLGDDMNDGETWEYSAMLGNLESIQCQTFEGETYQGRLYCLFTFPPEYKDSAQRFTLQVNQCPEIIYEVPNLSLMVEEAASGSSGGEGSGGSASCGAPPEPTCAGKYENWCDCQGGIFNCIDPWSDQAICWMP